MWCFARRPWVGFPGETDEEAQELPTSFRTRSSTTAPCLPTKFEEGTRAATMPDQVPDEVSIPERTQRPFTDLYGAAFWLCGGTETLASARHHRRRGGGSRRRGVHRPRVVPEAPDSDGEAVHVESGDLAVGDVVTCDLVDSFTYDSWASLSMTRRARNEPRCV